MNAPINSISLTLKDTFVAYCLAVTSAAIAFTVLFDGYRLLKDGFEAATTNDLSTKASHVIVLLLITFVVGWLIAFFTPLIPFFVSIAVARKLKISHWSYFVGGGFLTAALLCVFHAQSAQDGPPLGPAPEPIPSLIECYLQYSPYYMLSGSLAGLVCWLYLRRRMLNGSASQ